jgi:hypothetical protein
MGATVRAIANAFFDTTGARVREYPHPERKPPVRRSIRDNVGNSCPATAPDPLLDHLVASQPSPLSESRQLSDSQLRSPAAF